MPRSIKPVVGVLDSNHIPILHSTLAASQRKGQLGIVVSNFSRRSLYIHIPLLSTPGVALVWVLLYHQALIDPTVLSKLLQ